MSNQQSFLTCSICINKKQMKNIVSFINENKMIPTDWLVSNAISNDRKYFLSVEFPTKTDDGWKISIQGKTIDDLKQLIELTNDKLSQKQIPHKYGTKKLIDKKDATQSTKFLTIYVPNGSDVKKIARWINGIILNGGYKGGDGFKSQKGYEYFNDGIFIRNDRNDDGNYVPVKDL